MKSSMVLHFVWILNLTKGCKGIVNRPHFEKLLLNCYATGGTLFLLFYFELSKCNMAYQIVIILQTCRIKSTFMYFMVFSHRTTYLSSKNYSDLLDKSVQETNIMAATYSRLPWMWAFKGPHTTTFLV